MRRHEDWWRQAVRDLDHARHSVTAGDYEWACFAAQQAAEKAVKALLQYHGVDAWGHAVAFLFKGLPDVAHPPDHILDCAKELDKHYISPRYPDSHPQGAPMDFYTKREAEWAVKNAEEVLAFVQSHLPKA